MFSKSSLSLRPNDTQGQLVFEIAFGAVLPGLLWLFSLLNEYQCGAPSPLEVYAPFIRTALGLSLLALITWALYGEDLQTASAFFAGIFYLDAAAAFSLGIALIVRFFWLLLTAFELNDWAIILALLTITLVVTSPVFFTALAYWRCGVRALRQAQKTNARAATIVASAALGIIFVIGIAAWMQAQFPPEIVIESCSAV